MRKAKSTARKEASIVGTRPPRGGGGGGGNEASLGLSLSRFVKCARRMRILCKAKLNTFLIDLNPK